MWRVALGIVVFLQAGASRAAEGEEESAGRVDCPGGDGCAGQEEEAVVPDLPAATPAATPVVTAAPAAAPAALATLSFRNDVGKRFTLVGARFTIDGTTLPPLTGTERGKSVVISGAVKPGRHLVTAHLTYQGEGERRVFTYMKGYKLNVEADRVVTAPAGRAVSFTVVGSENKGMTVPLDKRVVVKVEQSAARN